MSNKSIEEKYKKRTLHEQILEAPDTFIGSIQNHVQNMWIYNAKAKDTDAKFILKEITFVPGFYKICDEVFVNAADHSKRSKNCDTIKIEINQETGWITVWNNGDGIDVIMHKTEKKLVPTMIFGVLLTSTNYGKGEKRIVGGKNGFGAKLANIYSQEFTVETVDAKRNKKFFQRFRNNMHEIDEPKIKDVENIEPYTKISFLPDYAKFGISKLDNDMANLLKKRVYDIAMTTSTKVYLNGEKIKDNDFTKYIDLYFPKESEFQKVIDISQKRWRVGFIYDPNDQLEHQTISFVNSICTNRGGKHVDDVIDQVVARVKELVEKKLKKANIKTSIIKENMVFFIDSVIENPDFDSQTKEYLTTNKKNFGSNYKTTDKFIKGIIGTGVIDKIIETLQMKDLMLMKKTEGKKRGRLNVPKLVDAELAGTKQSDDCKLFLVEGDSAKTFVESGFRVIGTEYYGVFPLKGKLLNVRDVELSKIAENDEITNIVQIMGLEYNKVYEDTKSLRYGGIVVLTDQDMDGSHIKGLLINFIHCFWPSLIKTNFFINTLKTPLIRAKKGEKITEEFYSQHEFDEWKKDNKLKGWSVKYFKGLGTHDPKKEAPLCFKDLDEKITSFYWKNKKEEETDVIQRKKDYTDDTVTLGFDKKRADDRKTWINSFDPCIKIKDDDNKVSIPDFINHELVAFSRYSTYRAIPSIMDGFKPGQRKVLYGCIKRNLNEEVKVAQLVGYISEHTAYHHGEQSLSSTIICMAQNYVGKNNINLLTPRGQFGSRISGGKDSASDRYIHTTLEPITKIIFNEDDMNVLEREYDDLTPIEPKFFAPIIPMVLVNGAHGIGTGYSTDIYSTNPLDICNNIKRLLNGKNTKTMKPWFRNYDNSLIEEISEGIFISRGKFNVIDENTIEVVELPIGMWIEDYKMFLESLLNQSEMESKMETKKQIVKKKGKSKTKKTVRKQKVKKSNPIASAIKNFVPQTNDVKISFTITFNKGTLSKLIKSGLLEKHLKLITPLAMTNMHLFDAEHKIRKYKNYDEIIKYFYSERLGIYGKRKEYLLEKWRKEVDILEWKVKFILGAIKGTIVYYNVSKNNLIEILEKMKFPMFAIESNIPNYNYLLNIKVYEFTKEKVEKLRAEVDENNKQIDTLENKTVEQMWEEEIDLFIEKYNEWFEEMTNDYNEAYNTKVQPKKKK